MWIWFRFLQPFVLKLWTLIQKNDSNNLDSENNSDKEKILLSCDNTDQSCCKHSNQESSKDADKKYD